MSRPTPRGQVEGSGQGWVGVGMVVSRPSPKGKLRGLAGGGVSNPTPMGGEVEGSGQGGVKVH